MLSPHTGIAGLEGRENVGAVVSVGVKGDRGNPIEKDRFHIVWPQEDANKRRPHHPSFKDYNTADASTRQRILGQLVHEHRAECFEYNYRCQSAPGKPSHPAKIPFCTGNGDRARRYIGPKDTEGFRDIVCPADKCEFRQGQNPACKPWARLLFRLCLPKYPTVLAKYTTGSWNTIRNLIGFFDEIDRMARAMGLDHYSLAGFQFILQLTEKTNAERRSRFPVVVAVPYSDPVTFFEGQIGRRERLAELNRPVSLLEDSQSNADEEAADTRNHSGPRMPSEEPEER